MSIPFRMETLLLSMPLKKASLSASLRLLLPAPMSISRIRCALLLLKLHVCISPKILQECDSIDFSALSILELSVVDFFQGGNTPALCAAIYFYSMLLGKLQLSFPAIEVF